MKSGQQLHFDWFNMIPTSKISGTTSTFVEDGHRRVLNGISDEIRREIVQKYAVQGNASGLLKRWTLSRRMEREIAHGIAQRAAHISQNSLY